MHHIEARFTGTPFGQNPVDHLGRIAAPVLDVDAILRFEAGLDEFHNLWDDRAVDQDFAFFLSRVEADPLGRSLRRQREEEQ